MSLTLFAACGIGSPETTSGLGEIALPPGGSGAATPAASPNHIQEKSVPLVRIAVSDTPTNIKPWAGTQLGRQIVLLSNVYQCVLEGVQRTEEIRLIMCHKVDRAYKKTEKGELHRIYLYDNIYDSEGNHFTASDAVFCIKGCVAEGSIPAAAFIGETKIIDEYTFDIEILSFNRTQLAASLSNVFMVTEAAYKASPDGMASGIVATGPYVFKEWVSGSSAVLVKNEKYWGVAMGERSDDIMNPWMWHAQNVDRAEFTKISEPAQAAIALETNLVDAAWLLTVNEAERFVSNPDYKVLTMYNTLTLHTYFNCTENSPFADVRLRQAVAYAIDRQAVIDANGGYGLLTNTFGSRLFADYVDDWDNNEYYAYNPERAKELIKESGFDTSKEIVIIVGNTTKQRLTTAEVVQAQLMAVGFNVRVDILDGASFSANRFDPRIQHIRIDQQAFENLANLWNQHLNTDVKGHSVLLPKDRRLQELVVKVQNAEDHTPENMTEAHKYIMENAFIYSLFGITDFDVVNAKLIVDSGGRNNRLYTPVGSIPFNR
jgi:ABC-type transport system substrate-binding protein